MSYLGDATGEYIELSNHTIPTTAGSLVHWFYPTWGSLTDGINHMWVGYRKTTSPLDQFSMEKFVDDNLYCGWNTAGTDYRVVTTASGSGLNLNAWNSVILTWDDTANQTALYINGTQAGSTTSTLATHDTGASPVSSSRFLNAGSWVDDVPATARLAEVAYFSRVLTVGERGAFDKGFSPILIGQPSFYFPLVRDTLELIQRVTVTITGATLEPHPRLYQRARRTFFGAFVPQVTAPKLFTIRPPITWAG